MTNDQDRQPMYAPLAELERHLIDAYLAGAGYTYDELSVRDDDAARRLLAEASQYASERLSEIDARSQYVHELRGEQ